jgi:OmpA-OmpF porin, OOP family
MKKIAAVLLLSSAVAAPAFADNSGFYAGIDVGTARSGTPNNVSAAPSISKNRTVAGVLGGYQFNQYWGVEAQYTGAGKVDASQGATSSSAKADAWGLDAVGTLPLSDTFSLYGKLGVASTKTSVSSTVPPGITGATRTAATYGAGLQYNASSSIGIRLGWDRYGARTTKAGANSDYNSNVYSIGALYKF